jgi:hypothetical protein
MCCYTLSTHTFISRVSHNIVRPVGLTENFIVADAGTVYAWNGMEFTIPLPVRDPFRILGILGDVILVFSESHGNVAGFDLQRRMYLPWAIPFESETRRTWLTPRKDHLLIHSTDGSMVSYF